MVVPFWRVDLDVRVPVVVEHAEGVWADGGAGKDSSHGVESF